MTKTDILWMATACCVRAAFAQMCDPNPPPPCARLHHPNSIFFVGTVIDIGSDIGVMARPVRFQVDEAFLGLPNDGAKEIEIGSNASLIKGHTYLIDAFRRGKNEQGQPWLDLTTCGATSEITSDSTNEMLQFLRARSKRRAPLESLTIYAFDQGKPVPGVDITVSYPSTRKLAAARTDAEGKVMFEVFEPGTFDISATHEHYTAEAAPLSDHQVDILPGACPTAVVQLRADSSVGGVMLDSKGNPIPFFDLDLIETAKVPATYKAATNAEGRFRFESVSPGTYWLGANLTWFGSVNVPPTYYPGKLSKAGAVPIVVRLGEAVSGLRFTTPDFGGERQIQVCVVDQKGNRVPAARILNPHDVDGPRRASLGETLMTDETGCTTAIGFTKVQYAIRASKRFHTGESPLESAQVVIEPGTRPEHVQLVLKQIK